MDCRVNNSGAVVIETFTPGGALMSTCRAANLVVNSGLAWIAERLTGAPTAMSHMAMGSYGVNAAATDVWLGAEGSRVALTSATSSGAATTYVATFGPGQFVGGVRELGLFNAVSGGTMLSRVAIPAQAKGPLDTVKVTWTVTQAT